MGTEDPKVGVERTGIGAVTGCVLAVVATGIGMVVDGGLTVVVVVVVEEVAGRAEREAGSVVVVVVVVVVAGGGRAKTAGGGIDQVVVGRGGRGTTAGGGRREEYLGSLGRWRGVDLYGLLCGTTAFDGVALALDADGVRGTSC